MLFLANFVNLLFTILEFAIIARALVSWFPIAPGHPAIVFLNDITEPILAPIRRVIPMLGMIDITPMVALIALEVLKNLVVGNLAASALVSLL